MRKIQYDEAELATRPEQQPRLQSGQPTQTERARKACDHGELQRHQHHTAQYDARRIGGDVSKIEAHADGDQEHAEQQALERIDGDLDLSAKFGLRQQQPRDQRAEFHRQTDYRRRQPGRENHQQARGDEQLRAAGARDPTEERAQHEPAGGNQSEHNNDRLDEGPAARATTRTEYADGEQHRHRGDILQQQNPERGAADRSAETPFVRQHLHNDRGRRHRKRRPGNHSEQRRRAKRVSDHSDRDGTQHELQHTKAKDQAAHHQETFERQLQADHEHHHADAEFGDRRYGLGPIERDEAN